MVGYDFTVFNYIEYFFSFDFTMFKKIKHFSKTSYCSSQPYCLDFESKMIFIFEVG